MSVQVGSKKYSSDFFVYTASFGTVNASTTQSAQIQIEADSLFQVQKLSYFCSLGATMTTDSMVVPLMNVMIRDSASSRQLLKTAVPLSSVAGTGQLPFIIPEQRVFMPNSIITVELSNASSDNYQNVFVNFIGRKLYSVG